MFKIPVFPPKPDFSHVMPVRSEPSGMHIYCDADSLQRDKVYQEWTAAVQAVHVPWWYRLWCWVKRRPTRPSVGPLQAAFDAVPQCITTNMVVHLKGELGERHDQVSTRNNHDRRS
jgi:hypothetical protein